MAIPDIGEGKRGPDGHMLYLIRQAATVISQAVEAAVAEFDLTAPQYAALTMIAAYGALSNAELSRLSLLTPQSASETVRRLEAKRLLRRRPDPDHGRIVRLEITAAGRTLLKKARARTNRLEKTLLDQTDAAGAAAVRQWLVNVAKTVSDRSI